MHTTTHPLTVALGAALLLALLLGAAPATAQDGRGFKIPTHDEMKRERRVALVIGNGGYQDAPLRNPPNDARLMTRTLKDLGFEVIEGYDLDQKGMKQAVLQFGERLKGGGVGLFYYAGHGMQIRGRNYLIPTRHDIEGEQDVEVEAIDVGWVLAKMGRNQNRLNIVILDACRNNPFERSFRSAHRGLASISAPTGTLIAYATAPGSVAADGAGSNGTYTEALVRTMGSPGLGLEKIFKQTRRAVRETTQGQQTPWESSSLEGDFFFILPTEAPATSVLCPKGTRFKGDRCVAVIVDASCPKGMSFEEGRGCVPIIAAPVQAVHRGGKTPCERGDADDCLTRGYAHEHGEGGVEKDVAKALALYNKACDAGSGEGCNNAAYIHRRGLGVSKSYEKAVPLYAKACELNSGSGCNNLGHMYKHGKGVAKDLARAVAIRRKSCDLNSASGCHNLANMVRDGVGVAQDRAEALRLYLKSCEKGSGSGCMRAGKMLWDGEGVKTDRRSAAALYLQGCEAGKGRSCRYAAEAFERGQGVSRDAARARDLYTQGCKAGDDDSCKR